MVDEGATYFYVVRAIDVSFNHSPDTTPVQATAETRKVSVVFTATVPATTDGTGRSVYIAGTLTRLDGGMPDWDPGAVRLARVDATHWTITVSGLEGPSSSTSTRSATGITWRRTAPAARSPTGSSRSRTAARGRRR